MRAKGLFLSILCFLAVLRVSSLAATKEETLLQWLRKRGNTYGFTIGKPCPACPRGAIASRDFKAEEVIARAKINPSVAIDLGNSSETDIEWRLLERIRKDPNFNKTFGLYWSTLPKFEDLFSMETFEQKHIDMLQSDALAWIVNKTQTHHRLVYQKKRATRTDMPVSFRDYLYVASIVATRDFLAPVVVPGQKDQKDQKDIHSWLIPAYDMLNSGPPFNVHRQDKPGVIEMVASRDIKKGEELKWYYVSDRTRPDISLLIHGYIAERQEDPLLCLIDIQGFRKEHFWRQPADMYTERLQKMATENYFQPSGPEMELARLEARWDDFPTTLEQDHELLHDAMYSDASTRDWRYEMILRFRIERKQAIRKRILSIKADIEETDRQRAAGEL